MNISEHPYLRDIDGKAFLYGMAGVVLFYLALLLYTVFIGPSTVAKLEHTLASERVMIPKSVEELAATHEMTPGHEDNDYTENHNITDGLIKAPITGLYEQTEQGLLPIIRTRDNLTAFKAYKRPVDISAIKGNAVSLIVIDFGLSPDHTKLALDILPPEITYLMTPYAQSPDTWQELARKDGNELWMKVPVQNSNMSSMDPGPASLLIQSQLDENIQKLNWTMGRTTGYAGLAAYTDETVIKAEKMFRTAMTSGLERGVGYLELNPNAPDFMEIVALGAGAPFIKADTWIYRPTGPSSFETLQNIAQSKGHAIGVIPAFPRNIKMIEAWIETSDNIDIELIPLSAMIALQKQKQTGKIDAEATISPTNLGQGDHFEPESQMRH